MKKNKQVANICENISLKIWKSMGLQFKAWIKRMINFITHVVWMMVKHACISKHMTSCWRREDILDVQKNVSDMMFYTCWVKREKRKQKSDFWKYISIYFNIYIWFSGWSKKSIKENDFWFFLYRLVIHLSHFRAFNLWCFC